MKYKCLVLDHDDTLTKSTPLIHYPSFRDAQIELRPDMKPYTLEEFVDKCFHPGFHFLRDDILAFNEKEIARQQEIWKDYTNRITPELYEGMADIIHDFRKEGGHICVVSHSEESIISKDYNEQLGFEPYKIFGYVEDYEKMKPNPYPLVTIMNELDLNPEDLLMVDDLKPGLDMAKKCHVDFAAAGWSHIVPSISDYMKEHANFYFSEVKQLRSFIF